MRIGLVGDYQQEVTAHRAIPLALREAGKASGAVVEFDWLPTSEVEVGNLHDYAGLWCVPASPYQNADNAVAAIEYARRQNVPFLGTCGGYQHAVLEFVRNVLGYPEADNAEVNSSTKMPLIASLVCGLRNVAGKIELKPTSKIANIYATTSISEEYHCGYGVNKAYLNLFEGSAMVFSGFDGDGDPRTFEVNNHPFFIGTAFQPERSALKGEHHPLISAFIEAASQYNRTLQSA